ncbi:ADP-ribosylglycohydrolase family protein [Saccharopolyspora sp. NPDC002578]
MAADSSAAGQGPAMQVALNADEVEFISAWRMYRAGDAALSQSARDFLDQISNRAGISGGGDSSAASAPRIRDLPVYDADAAERIKAALPGVVLGGAVGDSIGAPVEFDDLAIIQQKCGPAGVSGPLPVFGKPSAFTDDTQLLAFTLEALIIGRSQLRAGGFRTHSHPRNALQMSYARWLHTQGLEWRATLPGTLRKAIPEPGGWLVGQEELRAQRSPDRVSLDALAAFARATDDNAAQGISNFDTPLNQDKSPGALLRAAPCFLWSDVPERVFNLGANVGVITHGHPTGYLPSGTFATVCGGLAQGASLRAAIDGALEQLRRWEGNDETRSSLERALELAESGRMDADALEARIGPGWRADEALAIGLAAAVASPDDFRRAVGVAVNRSGNSTTPAAVCGAVLGALHGVAIVPPDWLSTLEWRAGFEELISDSLAEFAAPDAADGADWSAKYPRQL